MNSVPWEHRGGEEETKMNPGGRGLWWFLLFILYSFTPSNQFPLNEVTVIILIFQVRDFQLRDIKFLFFFKKLFI